MSKIMRELEAEARAARLGLKRYSPDPNDEEGYRNLMLGRPLEAFLDGELVPHCLASDEIKGVIVVASQPVRIGPDGELVTETRYGEVRVRKKVA